MSVSKEAKKGNIFERALNEYVRLLQQRPVLTKSVTSACVSGFSAAVSQLIVADPSTKGRIHWRNVFAYGSFGFLINGPVFHHLHLFLEKQMPRGRGASLIPRLLLDRLVVAPPYLAIFLYWLARVEVCHTLQAFHWSIGLRIG
ncbi:hypothetical protein ACOMHN_023473 [Nucella lapillus]